jgi:SAM-dependent methyltransferase
MKYLLWLLLKLRLYHYLFPTRSRLAKKYLSGAGIEIGALHFPLKVPRGVSVRYVDHAPVEYLRNHYSDLKIFDLVPIDIIDNGETLNSIALGSQNFIIANHFFEHCEDPIRTLTTHLSRLKPNGILYLAVPDKAKTFDKRRPVTPLEHMIRDFNEGPEWSRRQHYREWTRFVDCVPEEKIEERARELMIAGYSIHFHVWRKTDFDELLQYMSSILKSAFRIRETVYGRNEFIFILQKKS